MSAEPSKGFAHCRKIPTVALGAIRTFKACIPAAKVVGIDTWLPVVGIELCKETLIVVLGIVPSRTHEHHTLLNGLAYRLGDWSLFKNRF